MKQNKIPLPRKYWVYFALAIVFAALLFINIFRTDDWTGSKEFWEFTKEDWMLFVVFLTEEIGLALLMLLFSVKAGKIFRENNKEIVHYYDQFRYQGITQGDYDYVWFDYSGDERALIMKNGEAYLLYVQDFDAKAELWTNIGSVSIHQSLDAVRHSLFYDCDFYCDENTVLDKQGNEIFKEN